MVTRNRIAEVIPVVDIKDGRVVHAKRGERTRYVAISTPLAASADPMDVVQGILQFLPVDTMYIADLDAITGNPGNETAVAAIAAAHPGLRIWLDAGFSSTQSMATFVESANIDFVLATESISTMQTFERMRTLLPPERVVLSLDRSGAVLLGCRDVFRHPDSWPARVIHMNLNRVGSAEGPDWEGLENLRAIANGRRVYAAGGIRGEADLRRLADLEISGALVASALHDGRIRGSGSRD